MGRLKAIGHRLKPVGTRLRSIAPVSDQSKSQQRDASQPWRVWYKTARWQKLRIKILVRDEYTCQQTGELLSGKYPAANSPVVDHIVPHRGDEQLFWDENNLQSITKKYHDNDKQRQEMGGRY